MQILISITFERNSTELPPNATLSSVLCQQINGTQYHRLQNLSERVQATVLQEWPKTYRRSLMNNCQYGQIRLLVRAENTRVADNISQAILSKRFDDVIMETTLNDTSGVEAGLQMKSSLDRHEYQTYRDSYVSFQSKYPLNNYHKMRNTCGLRIGLFTKRPFKNISLRMRQLRWNMK
jgi:hypothetical protein